MPATFMLSKLKVGAKGRVCRYGNQELKSKMLNIGIVPDAEIKLVRIAPFGGAYFIELDSHFYALRKDEANALELYTES
jgi:Fe2+ transport system protein FeoA